PPTPKVPDKHLLVQQHLAASRRCRPRRLRAELARGAVRPGELLAHLSWVAVASPAVAPVDEPGVGPGRQLSGMVGPGGRGALASARKIVHHGGYPISVRSPAPEWRLGRRR